MKRLLGRPPARDVDEVDKAYVDAGDAQRTAQVVLDFGDGESTATGTAFASWASTGLAVICVPDPDGTADHDAQDALLEGVSAVVTYIEPGIGFDVTGFSAEGTFGRYLFTCLA